MERKKILWVVISIGLFLTVILTLGYVLLNGVKGRGADDPASLLPRATPRIPNPQDYVRPGTGLLPSASPTAQTDGDIVVIYGQESAPPSVLPSLQPLTSPDLASPAQGDSILQPAAGKTPSPGWASSQPGLKPGATAANQKTSSPKPAATVRPAATASPKPRLVTVSEYWIQAASFRSRGKAEDLKASLAQSGLSSIISTKDIDGQTYYRVRIGPYSTKAEADGWLTRIRKLSGCSEAYVSKTNVQRTK